MTLVPLPVNVFCWLFGRLLGWLVNEKFVRYAIRDPPDLCVIVDACDCLSGVHSVVNRARALLHKLGQSELLTGTQVRLSDDSV